jgi:outer membrane protein OmpA-like peptidoglycan-associated protein
VCAYEKSSDALGWSSPGTRGDGVARSASPAGAGSSRSSAVESLGPIVTGQLTLHALASLELFARAKVEVDVPLTLAEGGDSPSGPGASFPSPSGAAMNDVRVGARVAVLELDDLAPSAAITLTTWLPSGDDGAFTGTGSTRVAPGLVLGGAGAGLVWGASLARRFQSEAGGLLGSEVLFGAGLGVRLGALQVGPEVFGSTVADRGVDAFSRRTTSLEALATARYRVGPARLDAGAGPGLLAGAGTPAFRVLLGASFAPEITDAPRARASQGHARARPAAAEPPPDRDGDGVLDAEDACPDVLGPKDADRPGCPRDRDQDGVADAIDRCPDAPGAPSVDLARNGCPADRDGDGVLDAEDACPAEKGPRTDDPKTRGCPTSVRIEGEQIVLLQQVHFATGRAEILADSDALLTEVAGVLRGHPELARVAVDGHTDSKGGLAVNVALSQQRALAVVRWLVDHGIDPRRLEARGSGPRRPLADNKTAEGRAKNRRIELQIRKKTPLGEAGWFDGPLED